MIEFRQKLFAKKFRLKNLGEWAKRQIKTTNPAMLTVSGLGAGYGIANYRVNKKRQEADIKLRDEQIKATNELVKAINDMEASGKVKKHSKKLNNSYKKADPDEEHPYILEKAKQRFLEKRNEKKK